MALERSVVALITPLLLAAPAAGDPVKPPAGSRAETPVEILASLEPTELREDWLALELRRVDLNGRYGLIYKRAFRLGGHGMELRLRGPALGRKRRFGLSFEARF
jgi:hypothetical protein